MFEKIQYISQGDSPEIQQTNICKALDAGCRWIQLRYKNKPESEVLSLAEKIKKISDDYGAKLIINDFVHVALSIDADGVHLGLGDTSVRVARSILKENKVIGGTANTLEDVVQRCEEKCNYIGLGPYQFTSTKEKLSPILGIEGYQNIIKELQNRNINIPLYAIGGIEENDIPKLEKIGIYGVAVSGLITHHQNPKQLFKSNKIWKN